MWSFFFKPELLGIYPAYLIALMMHQVIKVVDGFGLGDSFSNNTWNTKF